MAVDAITDTSVKNSRKTFLSIILTGLFLFSYIFCINNVQGTVEFSSFIGGSKFDSGRDVAVDKQGNAYITGGLESKNFPFTNSIIRTGSPESSAILLYDVFIIKVDPNGRILWSTVLGGPNYDRAYTIEVDDSGYVYVAGRAGKDFPVTGGAAQTSFQGGQEAPFYGPQDGFVAKVTPDGKNLVFATYFGTSDPSIIRDLAIDKNGNIFIASGYTSGIYPANISSAFINNPKGRADAVFAKIQPDGSRIAWATYVGGSADESNQNTIRTDGAGNPYFIMTTDSAGIATPGSFDTSYGGGGDIFLGKLNPANGNLVWGGYVGGSGNESTETHEFAVNSSGQIVVAGPTTSNDFPITANAFQKTFNGGSNDVSLLIIPPDGSTRSAGSYFGGSGSDRAEGVAIDASGNVYFTGTTSSTNLPVTSNADQKSLNGARDAIIVKMSPSLDRLLYSSYVGGIGDEFGRGLDIFNNNAFLTGQTDSSNWPVKNAFQANLGGSVDAFVAKILILDSSIVPPSTQILPPASPPTDGGSSPFLPSPTGPPIVTSISVIKAVLGQTIEIYGTNLVENIRLEFSDGRFYTVAGVVNDQKTVVSFDIPNLPAGSYKVSVVEPNGSATSSQNLEVIAGGPPFKPIIMPSIPTQGLPGFGQLIELIFTWSLSVLGIVVFVQIFYAGFRWFTAAGNTAQVNEARSRITNAITGAIILLAAWIILYTINPDLVGGVFKLPGVGG